MSRSREGRRPPPPAFVYPREEEPADPNTLVLSAGAVVDLEETPTGRVKVERSFRTKASAVPGEVLRAAEAFVCAQLGPAKESLWRSGGLELRLFGSYTARGGRDLRYFQDELNVTRLDTWACRPGRKPESWHAFADLGCWPQPAFEELASHLKAWRLQGPERATLGRAIPPGPYTWTPPVGIPRLVESLEEFTRVFGGPQVDPLYPAVASLMANNPGVAVRIRRMK